MRQMKIFKQLFWGVAEKMYPFISFGPTILVEGLTPVVLLSVCPNLVGCVSRFLKSVISPSEVRCRLRELGDAWTDGYITC